MESEKSQPAIPQPLTTESPGTPIAPVKAEGTVCPVCHTPVNPADYFCANCGKALKEKPKPVSLMAQIPLYIGSVLLPPLGIIWGLRYLRQEGSSSKMVGVVAIGLTVVSMAAAVVFTINLVKTVNEQVNEQVNNLMAL